MLARNLNSTFHQEVISSSDSYKNIEKREGVSYIKAVKYHQHYHAEEQSGICVVRRKDETVEDLLKRFRKKYSKSGVSKEIRDRMYFEKPSDKKRRKRAQSIRNIKREMEKEEILREKMDTKKQKGGSFNRTRYGDQNDSSSSR